jgi:hypothetical protein
MEELKLDKYKDGLETLILDYGGLNDLKGFYP